MAPFKKVSGKRACRSAVYRGIRPDPKGDRYGNRIFRASGEQQENPELHSLFRALLDAVYSKSGRNDPYSAAALNSYFYFKEEEIRKIITTVEGIRYSLGSSEILTCLAES